VSLSGALAVPGVDLFLQPVAPGQQFAVARREVPQQPLQGGPEIVFRHAGSGRGLFFDQVMEGF
jgi:hypothetical protein